MSVRSFVTPAGVPVPAVTTDGMREVDRLAIEEVGPNLYQMMENAGRNLALTVIDRLGDGWADAPIVVLAGTGGNGGGGICAARHLANRGAEVTVVVSDRQALGEVPAAQLSIFDGTAGRLAEPADLESLQAALVVDAIIGYSLSGPPRAVPAEMIDWAARQDGQVVALDVPSGIDSTTGRAPGAHIESDVCLTLALPKTGLDVPAVGELWLADIGIPVEVYRRMGLDVSPLTFGSGFRVPLWAVRQPR
jgi:NAD(P)H-hydrate epimerase